MNPVLIKRKAKLFQMAGLPDPLRCNPITSSSPDLTMDLKPQSPDCCSDPKSDSELESDTEDTELVCLEAQAQSFLPVMARLISIVKPRKGHRQNAADSDERKQKCLLRRHGAVHKKASMAQIAVNSKPTPGSAKPQKALRVVTDHILETRPERGYFREETYTPIRSDTLKPSSQPRSCSVGSTQVPLQDDSCLAHDIHSHLPGDSNSAHLLSSARTLKLEGRAQSSPARLHPEMDPIFHALIVSNYLVELLQYTKELQASLKSQLPDRGLKLMISKVSLHRTSRSTSQNTTASPWSTFRNLSIRDKLEALEALIKDLQQLDQLLDDLFCDKSASADQIVNTREIAQIFVTGARDYLLDGQVDERPVLDLVIMCKTRRPSVALSIMSSWSEFADG